MSVQKQKTSRLFLSAFILLALLFVVAGLYSMIDTARAAPGINQRLNFQGRFFSSTGAVIPDGDYNIEFKIVQDGNGCNPSSGTFPCGGTVQWTETRTGANKITVRNGYFSVELGSVTTLPTTIWNQDTLWLTANLGGTGAPAFDGEMKPMRRLSSSPYALNAGMLDGIDSTSFARNDTANTFTGGDQAVNRTSTTAFQIQNAGGTGNLFVADTNNTKIGIGAAPTAGGATLQVTGTINSSGTITVGSNTSLSVSTLTIGGTGVCTASGCTAASGSGSYIQNGTSLQTANFNIQSAAAGSIAGVIRGAAGQSADLLQFQNNAGTPLSGFNSAGDLYLGDNGNVNILLTSEANPTVYALQLGKDTNCAAEGKANGCVLKEMHISSADNTTDGSAAPIVINPGAAAGTNRNGAFIAISGGLGTGTGKGGDIIFNISPPSSGTFVNAWAIDGGAGQFYPLINDNYDIGLSSNRVKSFYSGNIDIASTTSTTGQINQNGSRLLHTFGTNNFFSGKNAGNFTTTGTGANTGVGTNALQANTTGNNNAALGANALVSNQSGNLNSALGSGALGFNVGGIANTAAGALSLFSNTSGNFNTALGYQAGYTSVAGNANTTGSNNTFIGYNSGSGSATQLQNATAIGTSAVVNQNDSLVLGCINGTNGCTASTKVGIGTSTPGYSLDVVGDVNSSTAFKIAGTSICTSSGCTAASGSTNYIQNGTSPQTANFNVTGTGTIGSTLGLGGNLSLGTGAKINFFADLGDKEYYFNNTFGRGVESLTLTDWTFSRYRLRVGGTSSSTGTEKLTVTTTGIKFGGGDAAQALDITGNGLFSGTVTGTTLNGTTGINTGAAAGTQRIDATGNLVNVGNITGAGAVTLQSAAATALILNSGTTGALTVDSGTTGDVNIATGSNAKTTTIGNATGGSTIAINCGTGTCGFGNNATDHSSVVGSTTGTSATTIQSGTGGIAIGNNAVANTVQIGNTTGAVAQTINLGNNATASSTNTINLGSTIGTSSTTIQGGSGNIKLTPSGSSNTGVLLKPTADSTAAFLIQNANADTTLFAANTTGRTITVAGNTTTFATLTIDNAHFKSTQTTAPTIGTPATCGTTPTAVVTAGSTDSAGSFYINAGSLTTGICTTVITFNKGYAAAPKSVMLTRYDGLGGTLPAAGQTQTGRVTATSTTTFTVNLSSVSVAGARYGFYYWVIE